LTSPFKGIFLPLLYLRIYSAYSHKYRSSFTPFIAQNPNIEIRNTKQIQNSNIKCSKPKCFLGTSNIYKATGLNYQSIYFEF